MFNSQDFREMIADLTVADLEEIKSLVEDGLEERAVERYEFLKHQLLDAYRCLEKEFPCSEFIIHYDGEEINLLDYTIDDTCFRM